MLKILKKPVFFIMVCCIAAILSYLIFHVSHHKSARNMSAEYRISLRHKNLAPWLTAHTSWHQVGSNAGWAGFDKVYFIAMPDRIQHVMQVADRLGIAQSAWVLNAVNKNSLNIDELVQLNIVDQAYIDKIQNKQYGAIGCQLSHLAVILDCYNDANAKTCVIFEDDLYKPAKEVTAQVIDFRKRVEAFNVNWDMMFLDYCLEDGYGATQDDIRWLSGSFCAHAYVIKKDIAPLLLVANTPMQQPIDGIYYALMQNKSVIAIGPDKARYLAQNRFSYDSNIDPGYRNNAQLMLRYR